MVFFFLFSSCGKVAAPLPPLVIVADTVKDSTAEIVRVADHLQIIFSLPSQNIQWVEMYRDCSNPIPDPDNVALLSRVEIGEISRYQDGDRFFLEDHPGASQICVYWLRFVDNEGFRSPISDPIATP